MRLHFNDQIKGGCGTSERGIEESQIFKYLQNLSFLCLYFTSFSKKQSKYSGSLEIVKFPINAHPGKDDLTWWELQHHCATCMYYCTQGGITCGSIEDPRKSSKAIDERVIINFRDKNVVIARFRDKNVYR